jgi:hypothetical protein
VSVAKTSAQAQEDLIAHERYEDALWNGMEPSQHAYALACDRLDGGDTTAIDDMLQAAVKMGSWAGKLLERREQAREARDRLASLLAAEAEAGKNG